MSNLPVRNLETPQNRVSGGRRIRRAVTVAACAAALSFAFLGASGPGLMQAPQAHAQDARGPVGFADIVEKVRPAVVSVFTKSTEAEAPGGKNYNIPDVPQDSPFRDFFDQFKKNLPQHEAPRTERAQGSGFLISADGYIVTNHHVVDKATEIQVAFDNDEKFTAKVVGSDQRTDIALLKIEGDRKFPSFLEFSSEIPRVGDWVLAVGNPFGLGGSVTAGIVSAGGRSIGNGPYDFLQIDAAVNKGNSGGPAVNLKGQVIGVNTAIYSPSGGSVGIAFAIPSNLAKKIVDQLKNGGKVSRGWLGVTIQDVNKEIAESLALKEPKGALITKIMDDGPSAKSELKVRDVVIDVNGQKVDNSRDLARKIADLAPDSDAKLIVIRDGKEKNLTVKLGTFPSSEKLASLEHEGGATPPEAEQMMRELGLTLSPSREIHGAGEEGVAITAVDPRSEAADKGLKAGDVILDVGGKSVQRVADVLDGIREAKTKGRKAVLLQVRTQRQTRYIALSLEAKKK